MSARAVVGIKLLAIKRFPVCLFVVTSLHPPCLNSGSGPFSKAGSGLISGAKTRSKRGFIRWKGGSSIPGGGGSISSVAAGSVFGRRRLLQLCRRRLVSGGWRFSKLAAAGLEPFVSLGVSACLEVTVLWL